MKEKLVSAKNVLSCFVYVFPVLFFYLLLVLFVAVISYYLNLEYVFISKLSYIVTAFCLIIVSFICARKRKEKGWLSGILAGFLFLILLFGFSYLLCGELRLSVFLVKLPFFLLISAISGIIAVNI